ncbi:MAG TPA: heme-binding protein, partial [Ktedonobacteraceae bacterium]|nr:heme-binding protein [Ktedonobacteraceae bacterium]
MAENTFQKATITIEAAQRLIAAAEAKAREMGKPMCIAVCDSDGTLKAFSRMDGAALLSVQLAQDKAYTAISFSMATHEWHEFVENDPPLLH